MFREKGYLYSASNDNTVSQLPLLASQHLLDGGIVEFMDGNSGKINTPWVTSVLNSVNDILKQALSVIEPCFSIRSVLGMQSCEKSIILNTMYGSTLKASAGLCTRGINMFLVPCKRSESPFNAIIALDTAGLSSPEDLTNDASEKSFLNNRMALFGVLLADAALCISSTESNENFRDILSIVMAVYHVYILSNLRPRLFFLYNRASSSDYINGKEMNQRQDRIFMESLVSSWMIASNQIHISKEEPIRAPDFISLIEKNKYIERVQHLNQPNYAANDVPDPKFGEAVSSFNDHTFTLLQNLKTSLPLLSGNCRRALIKFKKLLK